VAASSVAARLQAVPDAGVALGALTLLNLMWGGSLPATKLALDSFSPLTLAAARLVLAAALFLLVNHRAVRRVPRGDGLRMAALGVVGFAGVQTFQALGASQTSGATATVLASTAPLWIALLAPALLHERIRALTLVGLVAALAGVATIMGVGLDQPRELAGSVGGNVIVLLSSVCAALYTLLGKRLLVRYSPLTFCTLSCLGGAIAGLPLGVWEITRTTLEPTAQGWALLAYLSVLVTFFGFSVWFWGLRALPASRAGALMFLQPVSGLALAAIVLGDQLTPTFMVGCVLVLAGVYVAVRPEYVEPHGSRSRTDVR
jgi:drug/metabolite transporter (DMT)-like permease